MKKIIIFILCISSLFCLTVCGAEAKETYTPLELVNHWESTGYPDYIGGVYYKDNEATFVVVLVNATQEEKDALIASIIYRNVETVEGKYSRNELDCIHYEIFEIMEAESGIYTIGTDEMNNRVTVGVAKEYFQKYTEQFGDAYGDAVMVKESLPPVLTVLDADDIASVGNIGGTAPTVKNTDIYYYLFVIMLTAVLLVTITRLRHMRTAAYSTAAGTVITHNTPNSRKEIIRQIESSAITPKDELFASIKHKISTDK